MTSLDSSEDDSGSFRGWEGCYFWSFVLSVCFVGLFSAVRVDLCAFILGKRYSRICGNLIFYVPYLFLSSCVRDSNQVVETIL